MKIVKIEVNKLFGVFDHSIPLMAEQNITIVIGENGLGKTVILEAINAFFTREYDFFYGLDFKSFSFYFDNNEIWQLTKSDGEDSALFIGRTTLDKFGQKIKTHKISTRDYSGGRPSHRRMMEAREKELAMIRYKLRRGHTSGDELEYLEHRSMMNEYKHRQLMLEYNKEGDSLKIPKWFEENISKISIQLIETQRLITINKNENKSYINNVKKCSEELRDMIENVSRKSSETTLSLDSTYPNRLIKKLKQGTRESFEDLNTALAKLDKRRKSLASTGLVVDSKDAELLQIKEDQKDLINTLKLYVDDSHKKLDPFEELSTKIKLFKSIVNKRFKHKNLIISPNEGIVFLSSIKKNDNNKFEEIDPSKLSSGEQNELVLFYKLIFQAGKGDMILIDEPELSLHISWQNKFIQDLKEVTSINDVSIIIATHSPDIIDENWDLKVELLGVE